MKPKLFIAYLVVCNSGISMNTNKSFIKCGILEEEGSELKEKHESLYTFGAANNKLCASVKDNDTTESNERK